MSSKQIQVGDKIPSGTFAYVEYAPELEVSLPPVCNPAVQSRRSPFTMLTGCIRIGPLSVRQAWTIED